jgi:hypothetical protein
VRVDGEQVLPVAPLEPGAAARLLVDRMQAGDPAAAPDPDELVAEVCRRLDHLPLALELAAARALPLGCPASSTPRRPRRSRSGSCAADGGPPRRGTAPCATSWRGPTGSSTRSGGRCSTGCRCSRGPVEYGAVVAVCGDAGALPDLVDRSLVVRHPGEPARFGMLETLRAFGRSRFAGDPAATRLRVRMRRGRHGWPTR